MRGIRRAALVVVMMVGSAVTTLALAPVPATTESSVVEADTAVATPPAPPRPSPTVSITPTIAASPTPTAHIPEPTVPSPTATPVPITLRTTPAAPEWPRTPDDVSGGGAASADAGSTLVPPDAWYSQEAAGRLQADLDALLDNRTGSYSVVVASADGYALYARGEDAAHEAASLYKLAVMVEVYRQRESGRLAFDDLVLIEPEHLIGSPADTLYLGQEVPVDLLLHQMIVWSSNVAGWALLDLVGIGQVNRTLAGLGLTSTFIETRPIPSLGGTVDADDWDRPHLTTAADLARLYRLLLDGRVVSPAASAEMLDLLARQSISNRLPAYLPWDTVVAHKTGNLRGIVHDAGVIFAPNGPLIVVVLTGQVVEWEAAEVIARIGLLVYGFGSAPSDAAT